RDPGVRARVHPAAVLRREGALPLGGAVGRGAGSAAHRPAGAGAVPGERPPAPLDRPGAGSRGAPGPAGAHLLAGPGRAGALRLRVERPGEAGRARGARRDRPRPSRHRVRRFTVPRDRGNSRRVGRGPARARRGREMAEVEVLRDAAVLVEGTRIAAVGAYRELRAAHREAELVAVQGVLYPGLIDCHTHAVFGAPRLDDHERRALGEDYKAIAAQGGGILQSVADVRARPLAELVALTRARVATLL